MEAALTTTSKMNAYFSKCKIADYKRQGSFDLKTWSWNRVSSVRDWPEKLTNLPHNAICEAIIR